MTLTDVEADGMTIADIKVSAFMKNRQVNFSSLADTAIIKVASKWSLEKAQDLIVFICRCYTNAAEERM